MSTSILRVLIIEDNADAARSMGSILVRHGCDVRMVCSACDAVPEYVDWADVAVVDLGLPDSPPPDTVRRIGEWRRRLGVVVVTGHYDDPARVAELRALGVPLLAKPHAEGELVTAVWAAGRAFALTRVSDRLVGHLREMVRILGEVDGSVE